MAIKATCSVTLSTYRDTESITRYYMLQSSTAASPAKPTTNPPSSDWSDAEPSYTSASTNTLYFCDLTVFSDGTWAYSAVSKSSSYEAAKQAYNRADNALNVADSMSSRLISAETQIEKNEEEIALRATKTEVKNYVASRGENLVTNGTALLGDNTNFASYFTYDGENSYYSGGSFKVVGGNGWTVYRNDEYIPVDITQRYTLSYMIKNNNASTRYYDTLLMYDIDKLLITAENVMWIDGSTTTLAQDLENGDTVVYLDDVSGFNTTTTASYQRGLIFWNYKNSFNYQYGEETYSRNIWDDLWDNAEAIDIENNTITLRIPWSSGLISKGTSVSQCSSGSTYSYLNRYYTVPEADTWTRMSGVIAGIGTKSGKFREGTAYVKVGWYINYDKLKSVITWLTNISLTQSAGLNDLESAREESASRSQSIEDRVSAIEVNTDSINISVSNLRTAIEEDIDGVKTTIGTLQEQANMRITEDAVNIAIDEKLQNGVSRVETSTGFLFNEDGLTISKNTGETSTNITENGMTVSDAENETIMLTANKDGVNARNLRAETYLIIGGRSRFENHGTNRTGCFWIGG